MKIKFYISTILLISQNIVMSQQVSSRLDNYLVTELINKQDNFVSILIKLDDEITFEEYQNENLSEKAKTLIQALKNNVEFSQQALIEELEKGLKEGDVDSYETYWLVNMIAAKVKPTYIQTLQKIPNIYYLDLDVELELEITEYEKTSESLENSTEPGIKIINAHKLWKMGFTGKGRIMMNIDTGVDSNHPSLTRTWRGNNTPANEAWLDQSSNPSSKPSDCHYHGTHVMGIMGGLNISTKDTIGVAFEAEWIASKGLCGGLGTRISKHIASFEWAMNPDKNLNTISDMPDVINNSWYDPTSEYCNPIYKELFANVEEIGIAIVFSAGNAGSGNQTITTPKNINLSLVNTFATGNVVGKDYLSGNLFPISGSSSRGPSRCSSTGSLLIKPEVCAPGTNIRSSVPGGGYGELTGTSMAAPHVAGAIVLLKQAFPNFTGEKIKLALYNTAIDLGETGEDNTYGNGLIDVYAAYQYLSLACENEIFITNDINTDTTISANKRIFSNSKINTGVNAAFTAGAEILLQPGFHAKNGSKFSAAIKLCNDIQTLYKPKILSSIQSKNKILGINNLKTDNSFSIYPNPASSKVTITLGNSLNEEPYSIMIIDSNGRIMYYSDNNKTNSVEVQLEKWPSGVYFGRKQGNFNSRNFKIIKK